jgi:hypothetical protein
MGINALSHIPTGTSQAAFQAGRISDIEEKRRNALND